MSKVQVLAAVMHQQDHSLLDKMNIRSDVIVGNQCDRSEVKTFSYRGYTACFLNFAERGVGLNRNNALMRATGEYCIFADADIVYHDDYAQVIARNFEAHPEADVIIFNIQDYNDYVIPDFRRLHFWNCLRYGTPQIVVRLSRIRENGIFFNLCFGGGAQYQHGEDNLFLISCLKHGLKLYASPDCIASIDFTEPTTWFRGYTEKYFSDTGHLYWAMAGSMGWLLCLYHAVRHRRDYDIPWHTAFRLMLKGCRICVK